MRAGCLRLYVFRQCQRNAVAGRHSITVPAIFAWADPDSVSAEQRRALPPGSRCDRVTSTLDVSATMLDALGAPPLPSSAVSRTTAATICAAVSKDPSDNLADRRRQFRRGRASRPPITCGVSCGAR